MVPIRFVSHSPRFGVEVVKEKVRFSNYGDRIVDQEGMTALFTQDDITEGDLAFAQSIWPTLQGFTTLIDEVTPSPLVGRISVYDTDEEAIREDWEGRTVHDARGNEHDLKQWVERVLSERAPNHTEFRQVEEIALLPPWPNYLQYKGSLEQLITKLRDDGYELSYALSYERQIGRPQVVAAIEAELNRQSEEAAQAEQVLA